MAIFSRPFFLFALVVTIIVVLDLYGSTYVPPNVNVHKQPIIEYSQFQKQINSKYPILVGDVRDQLPELFRDTLPRAKYMKNLFSPMSVSWHLQRAPLDNAIRATFHSRCLLVQTDGTSTVCLFHPSQKNLLQLVTKRNGHLVSPIDINDPDCVTQYPLYKHASYIEVNMESGMMLSIPTNWAYCQKSEGDDSSQILATANTLGSTIHFLLQ